jgi:hypothetical protein
MRETTGRRILDDRYADHLSLILYILFILSKKTLHNSSYPSMASIAVITSKVILFIKARDRAYSFFAKTTGSSSLLSPLISIIA